MTNSHLDAIHILSGTTDFFCNLSTIQPMQRQAYDLLTHWIFLKEIRIKIYRQAEGFLTDHIISAEIRSIIGE